LRKRTCSNKAIERDDDSKKSHPALAEAGYDWPAYDPHPGYALRRATRLGVRALNQFGLLPESLTTFAHVSISAAMSLANSAGEPASGVPRVRARRAFISGSAKAALISLLSVATIPAEMLLGDRAARTAIAPSGERECRSGHRPESRRPSAPAEPDRLARLLPATAPRGRRQAPQIAETGGEQISPPGLRLAGLDATRWHVVRHRGHPMRLRP
jgi:hypothetical protein